LRESFGEIGDTRLAVMAAIMVADELAEMKRRLRASEQEIQSLQDSREVAAQRAEQGERAFADILEDTAERIEQLAQNLNGGVSGGAALG
jgi:cell division protein ZapA